MNPQNQIYWNSKPSNIQSLHDNVHADVVIIGAGFAGLHAAQAWHEQGKKVIVLEAYYAGSGACGKSSGFVTPHAELSLSDFIKRYGKDGATTIWQKTLDSIHTIQSNINTYHFACDYVKQDTLILANTIQALKNLEQEQTVLSEFAYHTKIHDKKSIENYVASNQYQGGLQSADSFGLNGYLYAQQLKNLLQSQGVQIFEESPVRQINDHQVLTSYGSVTADYIIVCTDRFMPDMQLLEDQVYHAQTFIALSDQLEEEQIKHIFKEKHFLCWDTDLIYQYFRITPDNRLLIGGGDYISSYANQPYYNYQTIVKKLSQYIEQKFPQLPCNFQYTWPGLMGISKDISPIAGLDKDKPYLYYITASSGLAIAAMLGNYSATHLLKNDQSLHDFFSPYRKFPISKSLQKIMGKKISFALSNVIKMNIP
ncbi:MAG: NAD(P)/FAD-dependent oxidoreductase [Candidatus Chromulinivorax sp.]